MNLLKNYPLDFKYTGKNSTSFNLHPRKDEVIGLINALLEKEYTFYISVSEEFAFFEINAFGKDDFDVVLYSKNTNGNTVCRKHTLKL